MRFFFVYSGSLVKYIYTYNMLDVSHDDKHHRHLYADKLYESQTFVS